MEEYKYNCAECSKLSDDHVCEDCHKATIVEPRLMSPKQFKFLCDLFNREAFSDAEKGTLREFLEFNKYSMTSASKVISVLKVEDPEVFSITLQDDERNYDVKVPALGQDA